MVNLDIEVNMPPQAHIMDRMSAHSVSLRKNTDTFEHSEQVGESEKIKCVLVGDGSIGKSSLIVSYTTNGFPTEYVPTAFDNYSVVVTVDNKPVRFQLCDTAGQDDFDNLRPLCYPQTQVFLLCFSVVNPTSYINITQKWLPEIRKHNPNTPYLLIGTQCDLRNDVKVLIELANYNECPVEECEAQRRAEQIGAIAYIECSALTQKNLKQVFDTAIITAMDKSGHFTGSMKKTKSKSKRKSRSKEKDTLADDCAAVRRGWKKLCCFL